MRSLLLACAALAVAAPAASAATGDLDRSFGTDGTAIVRFADAAEENPVGLVVQSTGRIVVIGDTDAGRSGAVPARNRLQIVRLHADGSVDARRLVGLSSGGSLSAVSAVADGDVFYVLARHDL